MPAHEDQPSYLDVMVRCPMPDHANLAPERLGDFLKTEVGKAVLGDRPASIGVLMEMGQTEEFAVQIVLGSVAVKDADGVIMRQPAAEAAAADQNKSKKKSTRKS